jgi:hypothetical protein
VADTVHSLMVVGERTRERDLMHVDWPRQNSSGQRRIRLRAGCPCPVRRRLRSVDNIRAKGGTRRIILPMTVRGNSGNFRSPSADRRYGFAQGKLGLHHLIAARKVKGMRFSPFRSGPQIDSPDPPSCGPFFDRGKQG